MQQHPVIIASAIRRVIITNIVKRGYSTTVSPVSVMSRKGPLPDGIWPTMITPFINDEGKSIDWAGLDTLTEWYIRSGVAGLFAVCLSSEMFHLTNEERLQIVKRVVDKSAGRVPVVAGATFEGSLEDQAQLMRDMGGVANAVVIITNQIAGMDESDEVWLSNAQKLLDLTGDLPIGLYETPIPQVRSLTPSMLKWAAQSGRFVFHKDTSVDTNIMIEKIKAVQSVPETSLKFYTAKIQFLKTCLEQGGNGFSGITANYFPWMPVWMTDNYDHSINNKDKIQTMHEFLSVTDAVIAHKYPTSAKVYLNTSYGLPLHAVSRMIGVELNGKELESLRCLKLHMERTAQDLNIQTVDPTSCQ